MQGIACLYQVLSTGTINRRLVDSTNLVHPDARCFRRPDRGSVASPAGMDPSVTARGERKFLTMVWRRFTRVPHGSPRECKAFGDEKGMRKRLTDIRGTSSRSRPRDCSGERASSATGLRREGGRSALTRKPGDRPCASARALTKEQRTGCSVVVEDGVSVNP